MTNNIPTLLHLTGTQVIREAKELQTDPDDDPNLEYDRALVELSANLLGVAFADAATMIGIDWPQR